MIKLITAILVTTFSISVAAADLTILNSGSKTGGFSMQSTAYSKDLAKEYNVTLVNPGDRCVALGSLLPKIKGPVLMPWASDYEAVGRDGGCVKFDINKAITLNNLVSEFKKVDKSVQQFKKLKTKNRKAMTQEIEQLGTTLTHYQQVSNDTSVDPTYHKKEIDIYKRLGFLYKKIAEVTENKHYYPKSITLFQDVIAFYKKEGAENEESILLELISSMNEKIKKSR